MTFEGTSTLSMVYVANNDTRALLHTTSRDGVTWTPSKKLGDQSSKAAPGHVARDARVLYVANNPTNSLLTTRVDGSGSPVPGQSTSKGPAVLDSDPLLVAYVANNDRRDLLTTEHSSVVVGGAWQDRWTPSRPVTGQSSLTGPAVAWFRGRRFLVYVANNDRRTLLLTTSGDGVTWSPSRTLGNQSTPFAPALAVFRDRLYAAYVADNDSHQLLVTSTADGETWTGSSVVTGQSSDDAPTIASTGDSLVMAYVAANPRRDLLTTASTDGASWTSSRPVSGQSSAYAPSMAYVHRPPLT